MYILDILKEILYSEQCVEVNRTVTGSVSQPIRIIKSQEWYKYRDISDEGKVKLALNFSWMPSRDCKVMLLWCLIVHS